MKRRIAWAAAVIGPSLACAPRHVAPAAPAAQSLPPPTGPTYRFVAKGGVSRLPDGSVFGSPLGHGRVMVASDGSMKTAPALGLGGYAIPPALGGGYLYWEWTLYRVRDFFGAPIALAPLETNASDFQLGYGFVLMTGPYNQRRAFDLDGKGRVPLSPHGMIAVAAGSGGREVAIDAAGQGWASVDEGRSWALMTERLGGLPHHVETDGDDVGFVGAAREREEAWLQADGTLAVHPRRTPAARDHVGPVLEPEAPGTGAPMPEADRLLVAAIQTGRLIAPGRAAVADAGGVVVVDVETGKELSRSVAVGKTDACSFESGDAGGLLVCKALSVRNPKVEVVVGALTATPRVERVFEGATSVASGGGAVLVPRPCDGPVVPNVACFRSRAGVWGPIDATPLLPEGWSITRWLVTDDGAAAAEVKHEAPRPTGGVPRPGAPSPSDAQGLLDVARRRLVPWDAKVDLGRSVVIRADGSLRTLGRTGRVDIDPSGHVKPDARTFVRLGARDGYALGRDATGWWQTTDAGEHWVAVAGPPLDPYANELTDPNAKFLMSGIGTLACGSVGCVIPHPSTLGDWVRVGWPNDPPRSPRGDAGQAPPDPKGPPPAELPAAPAVPRPTLPRLACLVRAELTPKKPGAWQAETPAVAARPKPDANAAPPRVAVEYRDVFSISNAMLEVADRRKGWRAAAEFEPDGSVDVPPQPLLGANRPIRGAFVEPFDPSGRVVRVAGTTRSNPSPEGPVRRGERSFYGHRGVDALAARPVLSSRPGHDDGVLVWAAFHTMWLRGDGTAREVAGCPKDLSEVSAYADASSHLFVACESSAHRVEIIDGTTGASVGSVPPLAYWRQLVQPDALAVGPNRTFGVIRVPSVGDPATVDDPAWLLVPGKAPVELAPWSTIEAASSPACSKTNDGFRAIVETEEPWLSPGTPPLPSWHAGMTALVRWSPERVCLEAVEIEYQAIDRESGGLATDVMAVSRFVGAGAGAGLVGTEPEVLYRAPATCTVEKPEGP